MNIMWQPEPRFKILVDFKDLLRTPPRNALSRLTNGLMFGRFIREVLPRGFYRYLSRWFILTSESGLFMCRISVPDSTGVRREGVGVGYHSSVAKWKAVVDLATHYHAVFYNDKRWRLLPNDLVSAKIGRQIFVEAQRSPIKGGHILAAAQSGIRTPSEVLRPSKETFTVCRSHSVLSSMPLGKVGASRIWKRKIEFVKSGKSVLVDETPKPNPNSNYDCFNDTSLLCDVSSMLTDNASAFVAPVNGTAFDPSRLMAQARSETELLLAMIGLSPTLQSVLPPAPGIKSFKHFSSRHVTPPSEEIPRSKVKHISHKKNAKRIKVLQEYLKGKSCGTFVLGGPDADEIFSLPKHGRYCKTYTRRFKSHELFAFQDELDSLMST